MRKVIFLVSCKGGHMLRYILHRALFIAGLSTAEWAALSVLRSNDIARSTQAVERQKMLCVLKVMNVQRTFWEVSSEPRLSELTD
jgi:5-enolpyruvylshikimate-3-phosphate synthase